MKTYLPLNRFSLPIYRNADYAWENARTSEGQFYEYWSENNKGRYYWLLHQAALVDVYASASLFKNE